MLAFGMACIEMKLKVKDGHGWEWLVMEVPGYGWLRISWSILEELKSCVKLWYDMVNVRFRKAWREKDKKNFVNGS